LLNLFLKENKSGKWLTNVCVSAELYALSAKGVPCSFDTVNLPVSVRVMTAVYLPSKCFSSEYWVLYRVF